MKVKIEINEKVIEPKIIIHCSTFNKDIEDIQRLILNSSTFKINITFFKDNKEYYISLNEIIFFETEDNIVYAHTKNDIYKVKNKLYELESFLPNKFIRVSKSAILNFEHIFSIDKNVISYSLIQFYNCNKQVYVSKFYYKNLKHRLDERRNL